MTGVRDTAWRFGIWSEESPVSVPRNADMGQRDEDGMKTCEKCLVGPERGMSARPVLAEKGDDPEAVLRIAVADVRRVSLLEAAQMVDGWHLGERSSKFRYDVLERIAAALREAAQR